MQLKKMLVAILAVGLTLSIAPRTFAGEIDILVDKLVEKGILSRSDANEILQETRKEVSQQASSTGSSGVPKWVQKTKLKGDFRLRYESKKRKGSAAVDRGRIRYRLGLETDIVDQVKIGAGLASGSDSSTSARSTNQDLENVFSTKTFSLDYAYAEYKPTDWASIIGGKFKRKNYLWEPGDLLFDTDINPEGGSVKLTHKITEPVELLFDTDISPEGGSVKLTHKITDWAKASLSSGVWVLDESSSDRTDPYLFYIQPTVKFKYDDLRADAKLAFTHYNFDNVKGATLDGALVSNTANPTSGGLEYKFTPWSISGELGFGEPFNLGIPRVAMFGEFVSNTDPDDENNGWLLGLKLGDKKVNDTNKWQLKYMFAQLQTDAFPDVFPDADRYSGQTDVKSHEGIAQFGLNKNIMVEFDYYHSRKINAAKNPENLFQASANFKF